MTDFAMGQAFERTTRDHLETAKVIAIVDGGKIAWLKADDRMGSPFELLPTRMNGWRARPMVEGN